MAQTTQSASLSNAEGLIIKDVEAFRIRIPVTEAEQKARLVNDFMVVRLTSESDLRGYSFASRQRSAEKVLAAIKPILMGQDAFAVERHLEVGLESYGGTEHAVWDLIGKALKAPVYRLLGGYRDKVKAYFTSLWWDYKMDQSDVPHDKRAAYGVKLKENGYLAMKIRIWNPDPLEDVVAARVIKEAVGDDFELMVDRTADRDRWVWDYDIGLKVARGMQEAGVYWLEEPFGHTHADDIKHARLAASVDIPITGGEADQGIERFAGYLANDVFDIVQPDGVIGGGILNSRKVGTLAQGFGKRCILHGTSSLGLAGFLHACGALPNSDWMEMCVMAPPLLVDEQWSSALKILNQPYVYKFEDGYIHIPQGPGLGLDLDEDAIERYRVAD